MKGISEFNADYLRKQWKYDGTCDTCINGQWVAARPYGKTGLRHRFRKAWKVFTGKADVLVWTKQ